jgi:hypothetical protein
MIALGIFHHSRHPAASAANPVPRQLSRCRESLFALRDVALRFLVNELGMR